MSATAAQVARIPGPERCVRPVAYALTFLTGATGLIYELVWQKYLVRLLGNDGLASAIVLGVFLAGLAAGYLLCGRLTLRVRNLLVTYGLLELAIAAWAGVFPLLFSAAEQLTAGWSFASPWGVTLQGAACAAALIGLPTACMGGTVPLLTRALSASIEGATRTHARVYALNTAGAFLGTLLAGFVLIEALGLPATLRWAAVLNGVCGLFFVAAGLRRERVPIPEALASGLTRAASRPAPVVATATLPRRPVLHAIAFVGGFYFMTLESLLIRTTSLTLGSSSYAFASIVAVFVLCTALGALRVGVTRRSIGPASLFANQAAIAVALMGLFLTLDKWPWAAHHVRLAFSGDTGSFVLYQLAVFGLLLAVLIVPASSMGATLPLTFHSLKRDLAGVGAAAGTLLAWNAAGNMLGGLVGGFLLYRWLGIGEIFLLCVGLAAFSAGLAAIRLAPRQRWLAAALALAALSFMAAFPLHDPLRFAVGTFRLRQALDFSYRRPAVFYREFYRGRGVLAYRDAPEGTFAVVENPWPAEALADRLPGLRVALAENIAAQATSPRPRSIIVNGKSDSNTYYDRETLRLLAHLPALLAARRERVLVVGLGTGVTAGELALYPDVRSIEVAEISPTVVDFLPLFGEHNRRVHEEPRLLVRRGDAFRVVRREPTRWDLILSEPSNPWTVGVDQLFSREFYRLVRQRLAAGGLFVQWLQLYSTDESIAAIVVNTVRSEFPHVRVFEVAEGDDLILASAAPLTEDDFARAAQRWNDIPAVAESLAAIGVTGMADLRGLERPETVRRAAEQSAAGLERLDHPRIHYRSGRAFFRGIGIGSSSVD